MQLSKKSVEGLSSILKNVNDVADMSESVDVSLSLTEQSNDQLNDYSADDNPKLMGSSVEPLEDVVDENDVSTTNKSLVYSTPMKGPLTPMAFTPPLSYTKYVNDVIKSKDTTVSMGSFLEKLQEVDIQNICIYIFIHTL